MLEVCRPQTQHVKEEDIPKKKDIIITRYTTTTEYDKNRNQIIKRIPKQVNITKVVNESKKLLKRQNAEKTLAELEKYFTKEGK